MIDNLLCNKLTSKSAIFNLPEADLSIACLPVGRIDLLSEDGLASNPDSRDRRIDTDEVNGPCRAAQGKQTSITTKST